MRSDEYQLGKRLKNKQFKNILEVQDVNGVKLWVDLKCGDTYNWVDEDLYDDLDYCCE